MNGKPNQRPIAHHVDREAAWVRWWRRHPEGKPVLHVETKGKRKRARRVRRDRRPE